MSAPARAALRAMIDGYRAAQLVGVSAELGLADLINSGVRTYQQLAERTGANPAAMRRLLRALCALEVLDCSPPDGVALNEMSRCLLAGDARSLNPWARLVLDQFYPSWGALKEAVISGGTGFEKLHGLDAWTHRARDARSGALFSAAMASSAAELSEAVASGYDFSTVPTLVDVGGGDGTLAQALLRRYANVNAIVLDADVPAHVPPELAARMSVVQGDFRDGVPPKASCYVLSRVLHDWDDAAALRILQNVARAMDANGVVLIVERLMTDAPPLEFAISDIHMMVMNGGRERTREEFVDLLENAGLALERALRTISPFSILEARRP
jgi:hypothetical protein